MADQFNSLMSAPGAMLGLAQLAGGIRSQNAELAQQRADRDDNMFMVMQQQMAMDRQMGLQSQQLASQEAQSAREFALRREESAFSRLNQALETQLKFSEQEAQQRDTAFQRSMQAQMFQLQTKQQMLQLERVELENRRIDFQGKLRSRFVGFQSSPEKEKEADAFINDLVNLKDEYEDVMGMDEAVPLVNSIGGMIEAAKQIKPRLYKISDTLVPGSDTFSIDEIRTQVSKIDFSKPLTADDRQALSFTLQSALREYDPKILSDEALRDLEAPLDLDLDGDYSKLNDAQKARIALMQYAMEKVNDDPDGAGGNEHLRHIFRELRDPVKRVQFDAAYSQGLLKPIESQETLIELQKIESAREREDANFAAFYGPSWYSATFRPQRQELLDDFKDQEYEILSGGNPLAKRVMDGGIDTFNRVNEEIKLNALSKYSWGDVAEAGGLAGAGRTVANFFTGNWGQLNLKDAGDLALTAMWFVPGGALVRGGLWAARGGAAGVRAISTGLRMRRTAKAAGWAATKLSAPRPLAATAQIVSGRAGQAVTGAQEALVAAQAQQAATRTAAVAAGRAEGGARAAVRQAAAAPQLTPDYVQTVAAAQRQMTAQQASLTRAQNAVKQARAAELTAEAQLNVARGLAGTASKSGMFQQAASRSTLSEAAQIARSQRATATQRVAARRALLAEKEATLRALKEAPKFAEEALNAARAQATAAAAASQGATRTALQARTAARQAATGLDEAVAARRALGRRAALETAATVGQVSTVGIGIYRREAFGDLDEASDNLDKVIYQADAMLRMGIRDPKIIASVETALNEYRERAKSYYNGELPLEYDLMLDLRRVLPRSMFNRLQTSALQRTGQSRSLMDLRMEMSGASMMQQTAPGTATGRPSSFSWSNITQNPLPSAQTE